MLKIVHNINIFLDQNGNTKLLLREHSACDSVEHSFKEKLSVQSKRNDKDEKELEVFEMLEGATLHSSFSRYYILSMKMTCSSIYKIQVSLQPMPSSEYLIRRF